MSRFQQYLLPAAIAGLLIGGAFWAGSFWSRAEAKPEKSAETVSLPHGRVLYVVAEKDGAYIGEIFVPYPLFGQFIKDRSRVFAPDYVMVLGTAEARYGDVAMVFTAVHSATRAPGTIVTRPIPLGTRRPAIAVHEHFWEY